jgi:menaquinone-dependent protoporphyrinogen oxidase
MDKTRSLLVACDVPILYATSEGQTRRIAMRLAERLQSRGIDGRAIDICSPVADGLDWSAVRVAIVGASLHAGRHQPVASAFVRTHASELNARPAACFSVSLSIASKNANEADAARRLAEAFPRAAGWQPGRIACFAGRLAYTKYGWVKRVLMQLIARKEGAPTDTRRDYELTNWADVDRFADEVSAMAPARASGANAA